MTNITYVNGKFLPKSEAVVPIEDRGYVFGDGVYEVISIRDGVLIDIADHMQRLQRSLKEVNIPLPMPVPALEETIRELLKHNKMQSAFLYLQITRGVAPRNHGYKKDMKPSVIMMLSEYKQPPREVADGSVKAITAPEIRWQRRDIKSICLLPNILAKQQAEEQGAVEVFFFEQDDIVTEGSSTNVCIVRKDGVIQTHPANNKILNGITRMGVLKAARGAGITVEEKPFTLKALRTAPEVFITSTTKHILPIHSIDGKKVGEGKTGKVTKKAIEAYAEFIEGQVRG